MTETVGGHTELERHKQIIRVRPEELVTANQNVVDDKRITNTGEEVLENDPLIVPAQNSARFLECMALGRDGVMGAQKGNMQLRDNQILIITLVADQRSSIVFVHGAPWLARQIVGLAAQRPLCAGNKTQHHPRAVSRRWFVVEVVQIETRATSVSDTAPDLFRREHPEIVIAEL